MQLFALLDDRLMDQKSGRRAEAARVREGRRGAREPRRRRLGRHREGARADGATSIFRTSGSKAAPGSTAICSPIARQLVRAADERAKPNAERLREYTDARLAALKQLLAADTPVYPEFEQVRLSFSLERMREWLGPDDPIVKATLGSASPDERAKALVGGSKLADRQGAAWRSSRAARQRWRRARIR